MIFVSLEESAEQTVTRDEEILALNTALEELAMLNGRQADVVESRFFGGMSVTETASALGVSESAVERDWRVAKAWLATRIRTIEE